MIGAFRLCKVIMVPENREKDYMYRFRRLPARVSPTDLYSIFLENDCNRNKRLFRGHIVKHPRLIHLYLYIQMILLALSTLSGERPYYWVATLRFRDLSHVVASGGSRSGLIRDGRLIDSVGIRMTLASASGMLLVYFWGRLLTEYDGVLDFLELL